MSKKQSEMRVRAFPMTIDDNVAKDMLTTLKTAFQRILKDFETPGLSWEELYRGAYTLVLHKHGAQLYYAVKQVVTEHLEKVRQDVVVSHNNNFLDTLNAVWYNYRIAMLMIGDCVEYMNRVYCQQNGVDGFRELALILFRELVVKYDNISDRLCQTLLSLVKRERRGEAVDRKAIQNACKMLMELGVYTRYVYEDYFEKPFLQESAEFFKLESQKLLTGNNASIYLQKAETRINEESERAQHCLDPTTKKSIVKVVEEELIHKHMKAVIEMENSGVNHMLKHNRVDDLARMLHLFNRVKGKNDDSLLDWLKMVHECMRRYFPEETTQIESENPITYIQEIEHVVNLITENAVPPEILARGPLALQAYNKALAEGITCQKRVPVMLIGQERSGKTSLKRSLRGEPFNPDEKSTVGIDVDPSHFKVTTEIWKVGEKDQEANSETTISYEHHAARLTVENLRQEKSIPKEPNPPESMQSGGTPLVETASESMSSDSISASLAPDVTNASSHGSSQVGINDLTSGSSAAAVPSTSNQDSAKLVDISKDPRSSELSSDLESTQTSRYPQPVVNIPDMPEDIATLIEMLLKEVDKVEAEEDIYSVLWDFAGQSVYYTTHILFLTARAVYLLVNDLSQNPHERANPVVMQGMFSKLEDPFGVKSNLNYLDLWMSSVASLAIQDESHQVGHESEVLTEKLPPVFLVCTHADDPYGGGDPYTLAQAVFGYLRAKPYKSHLYEDVFVVDNTKSGSESECSEIVRLRQEVLEFAKELPQLKEAIPIKWLRYEKALLAMKKDGHKWIPLDNAKKIATEVCNIVDGEQFQTLLNFLHDQRVLIHFDDSPKLNQLVVLDPQWLIDVFKKVITVKPFNRKEKKFEELWRKLEEAGILEEKLLEHVWGPLFDNKETSASLLEIMEKFSLLCPWPSSEGSCSKQYLVPSMLMSHPPEGITQLVASAQIPPLFLKFESGQVPLGLFPRLVLQYFQWGKDKYVSSVDPQLYHDFARFYTSKECSVILLCHSSFIEVVVHGGNPTRELAESLQSKLTLSTVVSCEAFDVTCARAVHRQLALMLESMRNEFCWLKNMRYEVNFLCPVCCQGGKVNCCRKHRAQGCKQEECLHFWSESKLYNTEINVCTRSAVAKNTGVDIKQFAPWLAPIGNQHAIDEGDGRNVSPVEASKEIALPAEVKSLLSQSCDANEVVLQLKESLQLTQTSLEKPEPETKTLIRCLARKAKDSNRIDVFDHLREITPAGTTGPLLPELLDVRNIPVCKGRELTIDLSGGEEWKVIAEGLGLTPQEIRFLNSRTLNLLDAALAFVAKQRLVTVVELYDLLCKSGYPLLADIL